MTHPSSLFHDGERAVQARAGERATAERHGAMVADAVSDNAGAFVARQFMVAVGTSDAAGDVWASLLFGRPGFARAEDIDTLRIDTPAARRDATDPVWANLRPAAAAGLLFIDLGMRRRYRVNGTVRGVDDDGFEIDVRETFPNCPRYIQRRRLVAFDDDPAPSQAALGRTLGGSVEAVVRQADTLFVASRHARAGTDVSHRGGEAGFVRVIDASTLRIPDFPGNSLFNTLGNLAVDPHAGLCIPDFESGRLLQLTGTATLRWDVPDEADDTGGTGRHWDFHIDRWILRDAMQRARWECLDASPFNPHPQT